MPRKHPHPDARPTLPGVIWAAALALIAAGALGWAPLLADESKNPFTGPSAAGERLLMESAGLVPRTVRTPSSTTPWRAHRRRAGGTSLAIQSRTNAATRSAREPG